MAPGARTGVSPEAQRYLDAVDPVHRPFLDRLDGLVRRLRPEVAVVVSCGMPAHVAGRARHPELTTGRGTLWLPTVRLAEFSDEDLLAVLAGALRD